MTEKLETWPTKTFWLLAALALVWNLMGVFAYIAQMTITPEALSALSGEERKLYEEYPAWAASAFAFAVFGGALGCILLLARNKLAVPVFAASLIGIAVQMTHSLLLAETVAVYGPGSVIMPVMVIVIGVALLFWSNKLKKQGRLK